MLPVVAGQDAVAFFEFLVEEGHVLVADIIDDLIDGELGVIQKPFGCG